MIWGGQGIGREPSSSLVETENEKKKKKIVRAFLSI